MRIFLLLLAALAGLTLVSASSAHAAATCTSVFHPSARSTVPAAAAWRKASTQGALNETTRAREEEIKRQQAWQFSMIDGTMLGKGDTPPMYFVSAAREVSRELVRSQGLHGTFTHVEVKTAATNPTVKGTLLLPVSGHLTMKDATQWSKTDTFSIVAQEGQGPNGDQFPSLSGGMVLAQKVKSLDYITKLELEVPLVRGKQIRLLYYRDGSGGPGGYMEGRVMLFTVAP
ncbi:MAG: hypothetical protein AAB250_12725 [Bdellovibrionota bacterium]